MTAVGKILVFLNLVFSLAVMGFATVDYIARTNWKDRHDKTVRSFNSVKASAEAYRAEADRLNADFKALNARLIEIGNKDLQLQPQEAAKAADKAVAELAARSKEIERLKNTLDTTNDKLTKANQEITKYEAATRTVGADNERRQRDVEKLREILKVETQRNTQLVLEKNTLRDQKTAAEIQVKSLRDINDRLENQMQDLARTLARLQSGGARPGSIQVGKKNAPDFDIEGLIRRVDGNLVTLTIGSDQGLKKGHTMEVFGMGANTGYRGYVRLVEVNHKSAVGQVEGKLVTPIRVGDTAASAIMTKR